VPPVAVTVTALEVVRERVDQRLYQVHSRWEAEVGHRVIVNAPVLRNAQVPADRLAVDLDLIGRADHDPVAS
jgi:hypothetical protein